ncbi:MAG: hypothetical protein ABIP78_11310 [Pyrinomonadaceae bacterium]
MINEDGVLRLDSPMPQGSNAARHSRRPSHFHSTHIKKIPHPESNIPHLSKTNPKGQQAFSSKEK